jgi:hypothetical protein
MRKRWSKCKISISKNFSLSIGSYLVFICIKKVIVAAKTADPHPKLPGTIYTTAKESKLFSLAKA